MGYLQIINTLLLNTYAILNFLALACVFTGKLMRPKLKP